MIHQLTVLLAVAGCSYPLGITYPTLLSTMNKYSTLCLSDVTPCQEQLGAIKHLQFLASMSGAIGGAVAALLLARHSPTAIGRMGIILTIVSTLLLVYTNMDPAEVDFLPMSSILGGLGSMFLIYAALTRAHRDKNSAGFTSGCVLAAAQCGSALPYIVESLTKYDLQGWNFRNPGATILTLVLIFVAPLSICQLVSKPRAPEKRKESDVFGEVSTQLVSSGYTILLITVALLNVTKQFLRAFNTSHDSLATLIVLGTTTIFSGIAADYCRAPFILMINITLYLISALLVLALPQAETIRHVVLSSAIGLTPVIPITYVIQTYDPEHASIMYGTATLLGGICSLPSIRLPSFGSPIDMISISMIVMCIMYWLALVLWNHQAKISKKKDN